MLEKRMGRGWMVQSGARAKGARVFDAGGEAPTVYAEGGSVLYTVIRYSGCGIRHGRFLMQYTG
jgi:hypothetical protein